MVAKPAVVGVAAAAFSTAAFAGPCMQPTMADPATGLSSRADDKPLSTSVDAPHGAITAAAGATDDQAVAETPAADVASFIDVTEPMAGAAANAEIFSSDGIKITSFQATMTANQYVASPFAPAPPLHVTDDLTFYGPAYLSVKAMSPPPKKRRPSVVGVGLVTTPSQNAKKSDAVAGSGLAQPNSPAPGRK